MAPIRKPYPSDVSAEEWSLVAPYLTLINETAPQRRHSLRELLNGLRYVIRYGIAWRAIAVQQATGENVELIYVDQEYTGEKAAEAAKAQGVELCVKRRGAPTPIGAGPPAQVVDLSCVTIAERGQDWNPLHTVLRLPSSCSLSAAGR